MFLNAIVIEDMEQARQDLIHMIETYCPQVHLMAWADTSSNALALLEEHTPDIAFVDLSMNGIDMMRVLEHQDLHGTALVIVTGNAEVNKNVVRPETVAYLNKPVDPAELITAVHKVQESKTHKSTAAQSLRVSNKDGTHILSMEEVIRLVARNNRTEVFATGKQESLHVSKTLKTFGFLDDRQDFCRIHHSYIVNLHHVKRYRLLDGGIVTMSDGAHLSISRQNLARFLDKIDRFVTAERV